MFLPGRSFFCPLTNHGVTPRQKRGCMTDKEIAKDIVVQMIHSGKLQFWSSTVAKNNQSEVNAFNLNEVCNAFNTVYQAVKEVKNKKSKSETEEVISG